MENNKKSKKKIFIIAGIIFVFLIAVVGVTYAYFSNSEKTDVQKTKFGTFSIAYLKDSENTINLTNAIPIREDEIFEKASKIEFSVTNDGDYDAILRLDLVNINMSANLGTNDMYWALYQDNTLLNKGNFGCETELVNEKQTILKEDDLGKGLTNTYQLYVYVLENDKNQSSMMNGTLTTNIQATGGDVEYTQTYNDLAAKFGVCPNEPDLLDNTLLPVVYSEDESSWMVADTNKKWYDYSEQRWANAVTVNENSRTINKYTSANTLIDINDIETMWVWIPRYNYDTTNLGSKYAGGTQERPGEIKVNFVSGTKTSTELTNYTHPAFRDGTKYYNQKAYDESGWDHELTGIWVAKFEMSSDCLNNPSTKSSSRCTKYGGGTTTSEKALIKPNMKSWKDNNISNFFTVSRTISAPNNTYGISTSADSHMIKNTEWGAVAYLSQSKYGKYGNKDYTGTNKEIYKNDSSDFYTGRSLGKPSTAYDEYSANGTYAYNNTINGTGASTTGNIYGIYDMSGGAEEYVMGNYNNTVKDSGFASTWFDDPNNSKYYDKYTSSTASSGYIKGDAIYETNRWYNDEASFIRSDYPWFMRGGDCTNSSAAGVFSYYDFNGNGGLVYGSATRASLVH